MCVQMKCDRCGRREAVFNFECDGLPRRSGNVLCPKCALALIEWMMSGRGPYWESLPSEYRRWKRKKKWPGKDRIKDSDDWAFVPYESKDEGAIVDLDDNVCIRFVPVMTPKEAWEEVFRRKGQEMPDSLKENL